MTTLQLAKLWKKAPWEFIDSKDTDRLANAVIRLSKKQRTPGTYEICTTCAMPVKDFAMGSGCDRPKDGPCAIKLTGKK